MSDFTVTIVGTGVIGTSMGLALKQAKDPIRVLGHDKELSNAKAGVKLGAFDKAEWNLVNACEQADLIVLAIPLNGVRVTLEAIGPDLKTGTVITDTTPSKTPILAWVDELLPAHVHFVGGNPIVRPLGLGYEHAAADLFQNKLYCLTPSPAANEEAVQLMVGLASLLGATPFFLDAGEHDGLAIAVEHLPTLLSTALLKMLSDQASWREMRKMAGGRFEQISAGAAGEPDALKDNFIANLGPLLHWLDSYVAQLNELRALLENESGSGEALVELLDKSVVERQNWLTDYHKGRFLNLELASPEIEKRGLMKQLFGFGR